MQNDACNLFPDRAIILGIKQTQISDQMLFIIRREEGGFWGRIRYLRIERRGFHGRLPNGYIQNAQSSPAIGFQTINAASHDGRWIELGRASCRERVCQYV